MKKYLEKKIKEFYSDTQQDYKEWLKELEENAIEHLLTEKEV